jgi:hypothetical protein
MFYVHSDVLSIAKKNIQYLDTLQNQAFTLPRDQPSFRNRGDGQFSKWIPSTLSQNTKQIALGTIHFAHEIPAQSSWVLPDIFITFSSVIQSTRPTDLKLCQSVLSFKIFPTEIGDATGKRRKLHKELYNLHSSTNKLLLEWSNQGEWNGRKLNTYGKPEERSIWTLPRGWTVKKKVKLSRYTLWRHMGGERYSSYLYLTSALMRVSGQRHAPAAFYTRGKDPMYPLDRRLGGPQSPSGRRG